MARQTVHFDATNSCTPVCGRTIRQNLITSANSAEVTCKSCLARLARFAAAARPAYTHQFTGRNINDESLPHPFAGRRCRIVSEFGMAMSGYDVAVEVEATDAELEQIFGAPIARIREWYDVEAHQNDGSQPLQFEANRAEELVALDGTN